MQVPAFIQILNFDEEGLQKNLLNMVVHDHRKVWSEEEKTVNYEHGLMYCAVHGYEKFKKTGKNYLFIYFNGFFIFNLTIFYF